MAWLTPISKIIKVKSSPIPWNPSLQNSGKDFPPPDNAKPEGKNLSLRDKTIYETSVPVLEGQVGSVHVGFWADVVEKEVHSTLFRFIGIIAIVPFVGTLLSFILAHWIVRPIVGLTEVADKVTKGDLETSVSGKCVESRDEIGDLARSLSACVRVSKRPCCA